MKNEIQNFLNQFIENQKPLTYSVDVILLKQEDNQLFKKEEMPPYIVAINWRGENQKVVGGQNTAWSSASITSNSTYSDKWIKTAFKIGRLTPIIDENNNNITELVEDYTPAFVVEEKNKVAYESYGGNNHNLTVFKEDDETIHLLYPIEELSRKGSEIWYKSVNGWTGRTTQNVTFMDKEGRVTRHFCPD